MSDKCKQSNNQSNKGAKMFNEVLSAVTTNKSDTDANDAIKEISFFTEQVSKGLSWLMSPSDIPQQVIYNGFATIAIYPGGEKIISRLKYGDKFDAATGLAMCIAKHVYGSYSAFLKAVESADNQNKPEA